MDRIANYDKLTGKIDTSPVSGGKLTGTTDTDYFYFLCPKCDGGGSQIMRITDFGQCPERDFMYKDLRPKASAFFQFCFKLYCPKCKLTTLVKLSNEGKQGGKIADGPIGVPHKVIGPNEEL